MQGFAAAIPAVNYLFAARAVRDFGDGFVAILLPAYLLALGFSPLAVGVLATASLRGSACLTLAAGLLGARFAYRRLLLAAAWLMIATGLAFASFGNYAVLLVIAFAGTINPSAGNVSVFVPSSTPRSHAKPATPIAPACSRVTAWRVRWPRRWVRWPRAHPECWCRSVWTG